MPSTKPRLGLAEATARIQARSFPEDSPDLVGLELEWLVRAEAAGRPVVMDERRVCDLVLPSGSALSVEPGGQLELSSRPGSSVSLLCAEVAQDIKALGDRCAVHDNRLVGMGLVPDGPAPRLVFSPRYDAMAAYFGADGDAGSTMMTGTASLQVNMGLGTDGAREARWRRANVLGPVLAAAFANSPIHRGVPSGFASTRLAVWSAIDRTRTASAWRSGHGCESWPAYVLDARVMFIRRTDADFVPLTEHLPFGSWLTSGHELGYPTVDDLDYHLTTLFPPVRPKGWLELRFLDALPAPWWQVATAVSAGLLRSEEAGARAERAATSLGARWDLAARRGLADPRLASAAQECFAAAAETMTDAATGVRDAVEDFIRRFVARARTPADERLHAWRMTGSALLAEDTHDPAGMAGMEMSR